MDGSTDITILQIEVNQVAFKFITEINKALSVTEKANNLHLLAKEALRPILRNKYSLNDLVAALKRLKPTDYVQNRFTSILGSKANPLLR